MAVPVHDLCGKRARVAGRLEMEVRGTGKPRRGALYADDVADALVHPARHYSSEEYVNIGAGDDVTVRQLAELVRNAAGYRGRFSFDSAKPDGTPQKLPDAGKMAVMGRTARTSLPEGLERTYQWYLERQQNAA